MIQQFRPPLVRAGGAPPSNPIHKILTTFVRFLERGWPVARFAMLALVAALAVRVLLNCSEKGTLSILGVMDELRSSLGFLSGAFSRVQSAFAFTEDNRNLFIFLSSFLATICILACIFRS
jgi:hypothetical protein